ncbi:NUDIX domain-containing protein [Lewinella sp. W8]|uniref:NUDIX hydrolase n=1 Tax=Lewinella sp. W8 TaxID=2528208 RepID=UPI0010673F7A|nr:NUDIX domain-containing protein [Lewinella sp. W8]MTB50699.1 NUDIX domain-containing protein [Lewinella sp. W8]
MATRNIDKEKVLAYIVREEDEEWQLLIFAHRDYPEAGWQVPGGTLEAGEDPRRGVLREVEEEAGLAGFLRVEFLRQSTYFDPGKNERHLRYFYRLEYPSGGPNQFQHRVSSGEEDEGLVFLFEWRSFADLPELAGEQGEWIAALWWKNFE